MKLRTGAVVASAVLSVLVIAALASRHGNTAPGKVQALADSASDLVGGVTEDSFDAASRDTGQSIPRPDMCAANDALAIEILADPVNGDLFVRYDDTKDPGCESYPDGSVTLREWPVEAPGTGGRSTQESMAARAQAMGPSAVLTEIGNASAILIQGNYEGDCDQSPAPGQEGCAPAQQNPTGAILQLGTTMIEVMVPGSWSLDQVRSVVESISQDS